ncbi:MAG: ABC transporter ATP-binding protein [Geminicoccaceae bacterium]|nr:ABC transporter ATP-binding protein [Geminicoccaceae bacterium]
MSRLIEVQDLRVTFDVEGRPLPAVKGVTFGLDRGETLAIVGESGSGKSVTALSILQLLPYPKAKHPSGSIRLDGQEMMGAKPEALRKVRGNRAGMIFQEPMTSLNPLHTVERQIAEVLGLHKGLTGAKARARVLELLDMVRLQNAEERLGAYPHQLSGGQRQRVMIAMALANDPDLLIADEPTTALDVTVQARILDLLIDLQDRLGMAILLITHDLTVVRKVAHDVAVMHDGLIVEAGTAEAIFLRPKHAYTKHLIAAEPKGRPVPVPDDAELVLHGGDVKVHFPIQRGLLRRTVGHVKAVDGVTLAVRRGETVGIVGESGSGKTTLGLALLRLIESKGRIVFMGEDIERLNRKDLRPLRASMQIVFQDPYGSLSPRMPIGDIVGEGLAIHQPKLSRKERDAKVAAIMKEVGLDPATRDRYPHEFSGGQRQRVSIARAMILEPDLVVLDEPTSALDLSVQAQIVDLLRRLQRTHGLAYLFISHDLRVVRAMSHQVLVMKDGRIIEQGLVEEVFKNPETDYTRTLMAAAFPVPESEPPEPVVLS